MEVSISSFLLPPSASMRNGRTVSLYCLLNFHPFLYHRPDVIKNDHCYWRTSSRRNSVSAPSTNHQPATLPVVVAEKKKKGKKKRDTRKCVLCGVLGDCPPEVSDRCIHHSLLALYAVEHCTNHTLCFLN